VLPASARRTAPSSARLPQARAGMDFSIKGKQEENTACPLHVRLEKTGTMAKVIDE
jgi:hypothetical protein